MHNVSIKKPVYAMASVDGKSAELELYGDIYQQHPTDWWGDPIEGEFILLDEFLADFKEISNCKKITVRINSYGGDAGVSLMIHNKLRELARGGAKLTCIVDGVAMSGGSLIMCACDTVQANAASLIMIHKCWTFLFGGYNADELRSTADQNDAWDKMQCEIYQRKTGLSADEILQMMAETTYMTGREAKEKGFVDELLEDEPASIAASADGKNLFVNGRQMHLAAGMFAPDCIQTVKSANAVETNNAPEVTGEEGGSIMTLEQLRREYPEIVAQVEEEARASVDTTEAANAAAQAERDRLAEIDAVAGLFSDNIVREAKYGEGRCTAAEMTLAAAQAAAKSGSKFLADAAKDAEDSGANDVGAAPNTGTEKTPDDDSPEAKKKAAQEFVKANLQKEEK